MKIVVLSASPRGISTIEGHEKKTVDLPRPEGFVVPVPLDSCCERLADAFIAGATEAGHVCDKKTLHELSDVRPCRACYGCLGSGKCVQKDDMQILYRAFDAADAAVFVSPIYYGTMPAQMMAVINRLYAYWVDGSRYPKFKAVGVLGTCADEGMRWDLFDGLWQFAANETKWPMKPIVHMPNFPGHAADYLAQTQTFGRSFG